MVQCLLDKIEAKQLLLEIGLHNKCTLELCISMLKHLRNNIPTSFFLEIVCVVLFCHNVLQTFMRWRKNEANTNISSRQWHQCIAIFRYWQQQGPPARHFSNNVNHWKQDTYYPIPKIQSIKCSQSLLAARKPTLQNWVHFLRTLCTVYMECASIKWTMSVSFIFRAYASAKLSNLSKNSLFAWHLFCASFSACIFASLEKCLEMHKFSLLCKIQIHRRNKYYGWTLPFVYLREDQEEPK